MSTNSCQNLKPPLTAAARIPHPLSVDNFNYNLADEKQTKKWPFCVKHNLHAPSQHQFWGNDCIDLSSGLVRRRQHRDVDDMRKSVINNTITSPQYRRSLSDSALDGRSVVVFDCCTTTTHSSSHNSLPNSDSNPFDPDHNRLSTASQLVSPTDTLTTTTTNSSSSSSSSSSYQLPISASQLSLPEPPDGGWGWIVVLAAFFVNMIADGIVVCFGILIDDLIEDLGGSFSTTSWIGAFAFGIPSLATPFASVIIDKFGCRTTCVLGGLISSIGCSLSFFSHSIWSLMLCFGIIAGFGSSLSTTAVLVIVAMYFDDRRATATGLALCGVGVGGFLFAPLIQWLIKIYTWRGACLVLGGIFLNMTVCGCLCRPVETQSERRDRQRLAWLEHLSKESGLADVMEGSLYDDLDVLDRIKLLRDRLLAPRKHRRCNHQHHHRFNAGINYNGDPSYRLDRPQPTTKCTTQNGNIVAFHSKLEPISECIEFPRLINYTDHSTSTPDMRQNSSVTKLVRRPSLQLDQLAKSNWWLSSAPSPVASVCKVSVLDDHKRKKSRQHPGTLADAHRWGLFDIQSHFPAYYLRKGAHGIVQSLPDLNQTNRRYRRGYQLGNNHEDCESSSDDSSSIDQKPCSCWSYMLSDQSASSSSSSSESEDEDDSIPTSPVLRRTLTRFVNELSKWLNLTLFRRLPFTLFVLSNFLLFFWYNVTYFFLGSYAKSLGMDDSSVAFVFSVLGATNMVGEMVVGYLADRDCVDCLVLYTVLITIGGVATLFVPLLTSFPSLAVYVVIFGICVSSNDALSTIILVELVGIRRLTTGLGYCCFIQGIANIIGPPVIGKIIDYTTSYSLAYFISGIGLVFSGLSVLPSLFGRLKRLKARYHHYVKRKRRRRKRTEPVVV